MWTLLSAQIQSQPSPHQLVNLGHSASLNSELEKIPNSSACMDHLVHRANWKKYLG